METSPLLLIMLEEWLCMVGRMSLFLHLSLFYLLHTWAPSTMEVQRQFLLLFITGITLLLPLPDLLSTLLPNSDLTVTPFKLKLYQTLCSAASWWQYVMYASWSLTIGKANSFHMLALQMVSRHKHPHIILQSPVMNYFCHRQPSR